MINIIYIVYVVECDKLNNNSLSNELLLVCLSFILSSIICSFRDGNLDSE